MSKLGKTCFVLAIISLLAFAIARFLLGGWMPFYTILIVFFAAFLGVGLFLDRQFFGEFVTMKTTKHGMNMGLMTLLVLALVVIVNYIAIKRNKTWDFSQAQTNTLSEQSIKVVKSLKTDLKVLFFYKEGTEGLQENRKAFRELLKKYQDQSDLVKLEFYELNENPKMAEDYGVTKGAGLAFVEYEGRKNRLERITEQDFTQAIIKVIRPQAKTVYYTTGHGEANMEDNQENSGMAGFKLLIENNSFAIKPWNSPAAPQIPSGADAIIIIGPTLKFADYEVKILEEYLKKGGNLMIALKSGKLTGLESLLKTAGITPENNFIKTVYMGIPVPGPALAMDFSNSNPITSVFKDQKVPVRMSWPTNLKTAENPLQAIKLEALIKTEKDSSAFAEPKESAAVREEGPFQVGVEASGKWPGGDKNFELLVYGDSDFLGNQLLYQSMNQGLNRDLALNSISQLTKEENLISIAPREPQRTELRITTARMGGFYISLITIPLCFILAAVAFFFRRRRI